MAAGLVYFAIGVVSLPAAVRYLGWSKKYRTLRAYNRMNALFLLGVGPALIIYGIYRMAGS